MRQRVLILGHNDATQFIDIYNQYTRLFDPNRYEVTVAMLTGRSNELTLKRLIAEDVHFFDMHKSLLRTLKLRAAWQLFKLMREKRYDIVICHRYKPTYLVLWVKQFLHIPAVVSVMHELGTMKAKGRAALMRLLGRKDTLFAGVSNAVRDDLRRSLRPFPENRIITLYNVIDIEQVEPTFLTKAAAREALNLPSHRYIFGNIARLAINKDHANLITAFSKVHTRYPDALLVIVGDGILEPAIRAQIETLNLTGHVILTGFVPCAFEKLKAFDAFVLSSIQEAFGRVLIEAMLAHCPLIATKVNGIPEVVGDAGTLVPPRQPDALANAMMQFIENENHIREDYANAGYQRVSMHFSIPAFNRVFWSQPLLQSQEKEVA